MKKTLLIITLALSATSCFADDIIYQLSAREQVRFDLWYFGLNKDDVQVTEEMQEEYSKLEDLEYALDSYESQL